MTNVEIVKYLREHKKKVDEQRDGEMQLMRKQMENLREYLHGKNGDNNEDVVQGSDEEPVEQEEEDYLVDQRLLVKNLKSIERRNMDAKLDFPHTMGKWTQTLQWIGQMP